MTRALPPQLLALSPGTLPEGSGELLLGRVRAALLKDIANRATKNTLNQDGEAGITREDFSRKKAKREAKGRSKSRRKSGKVAGGSPDVMKVHD